MVWNNRIRRATNITNSFANLAPAESKRTLWRTLPGRTQQRNLATLGIFLVLVFVRMKLQHLTRGHRRQSWQISLRPLWSLPKEVCVREVPCEPGEPCDPSLRPWWTNIWKCLETLISPEQIAHISVVIPFCKKQIQFQLMLDPFVLVGQRFMCSDMHRTWPLTVSCADLGGLNTAWFIAFVHVHTSNTACFPRNNRLTLWVIIQLGWLCARVRPMSSCPRRSKRMCRGQRPNHIRTECNTHACNSTIAWHSGS